MVDQTWNETSEKMSCRLLETSKISQLEKIKIFLNNQGYISVEDGMYLRSREGKWSNFLGLKIFKK